MKIEVTIKKANALPTYPYLGIRKDVGLIVLFIKAETGVVIRGTIHNNVGEYSNDWHETKFTPFEGTITLSNN